MMMTGGVYRRTVLVLFLAVSILVAFGAPVAWASSASTVVEPVETALPSDEVPASVLKARIVNPEGAVVEHDSARYDYLADNAPTDTDASALSEWHVGGTDVVVWTAMQLAEQIYDPARLLVAPSGTAGK